MQLGLQQVCRPDLRHSIARSYSLISVESTD